MTPGRTANDHGTVLLAVLVIVAISAAVAGGLLFRMTAEVSANQAERQGQQAYAAAMSGIEQAIAVLRAHGDEIETWWDNEELFAEQVVLEDGGQTWYFTVYAAPSDAEIRYGVTDENGKVNLNVAGEAILLALPHMDQQRVDSLLDYIDPDEDIRPEGAEQDYYDQLPVPYLIANGPLATLEELLLVRGFNSQVVHGEDANLNGLLDANEDDGEDSFPPDDRDGQLDRGLAAVATVVSFEPAPTGQMAQMNSAAASALRSAVGQAVADFIVACRQDGHVFTHPSELLGMEYELRRASGQMQAGQRLASPVDREQLPAVMSRLTTRPAGMPVPGLVNVNTASEDVLRILPGMDEASARAILDARATVDAETRSNLAWLYTEGAVDADTFRAIAPLLTTRSYQYHVRSVGYGRPSGRYRVLEAIVDLSGTTARVLYLRDLTRLGLPLALASGDLQ